MSRGSVKNVLGNNIRELRQTRGLNQEDVAKALGVSSPTYSSWERGRTEPSIDGLLSLARYFDVSVDRLLRSESRILRIGSWLEPPERFHPISQLSPLPDSFYSRVYLTFSKLMSEEGHLAGPEHVNRLKGMYRDILESRINKIVRLASAETSIKSGTLEPEEDIFYRELHDLIDSWRVRMRKLMVS